ncbi:MAG: ABC transporter permease, partial [Bacteroidales bacterium]
GSRFFESARNRIAALPGVRAAAFALDVPLGQMHYRNHIAVDGYAAGPDEDMSLRFNLVSPGYFDVLRIPIVLGRPIDDRDRSDAQRAAVVSQAFVTKYLGGRDPIGRTFRTGGQSWSIVGVMRDGRYDQLDEATQPYFCLPVGQTAYTPRLMLLVRTGRPEPAALAPSISRETNRMDPTLPLGRILTGPQFLRQPIHDTGGPGPFIWGPGLLALVLAIVGLYGLVAYSVSQRTAEFGLRMALGARSSELAALVIREGARLMIIAASVGLLVAAGAARAAAGLFYGIRPFEPFVFAAALAILMLCGLLACYGPARRVVRLDPSRALRCE